MKDQNGFIHLIRTALVDFQRNKVRTFLTSLGIMIGVFAVVMLISLGLGLKNYLKEQFESLGASLIMIMPGSGFGGGGSVSPAGMVGGVQFDEKDLNNLSRIPNVKYAVPVFFKSAMIQAGSNEELAYVMGVNTDHFALMDAELVDGKVFEKSDEQARAKVAVLGYNLAESLFDDVENAVGSTIRFSDLRFKVIGVLEKTGDREQDNSVNIPYKTTYGTMNPDKTFWAIYLGVVSDDDVNQVKERAKETLMRRYKEDEFSVTEQSELLSTIDEVFNILNTVLVAIGSISLIVGGIGIMNIMYASVTERTKEVGIRRAVGATEKDILRQFLTESILLSVAGGLMGLALSSIIVVVVRPFFPVGMNLVAISLALGISTIIGVFFGVFPARRAAKLPPIEAIRHE